MKGILVVFQWESNTGYAIAPLEHTFFRMAEILMAGDWDRIHFAYPSLHNGRPNTLPQAFNNIITFNSASQLIESGHKIMDYVRSHTIDIVFGFDQPPIRAMYRYLRKGGIQRFISYWGAPMSSINRPPKLWLKQLQVALVKKGPDHYIFESQGMAMTATHGRGIPRRKVSVAYLGVDIERYKPNDTQQDYPYNVFGIPKERRIFIYSGHMEERKGVDILIRAARTLIEQRTTQDFHLLILGNRKGEEQQFEPLMKGPHREYITFGGYRDDVALILRGCFAGIISSTGWDSFPRSAIEMSASGLPLLVSNLPGLNETVVDGITGIVFPSGNWSVLAEKMVELLENPILANQLGEAARRRAVDEFSQEKQVSRLVSIVRKVCEEN